MHRLILGLVPGDGLVVDHRNGNGLDNRRCNIRTATRSNNQHNQRLGRANNTSGYKGVTRRRGPCRRKPWRACIRHERRTVFIGHFATPEAAAAAYDRKAAELFGEFASLNFPRRGRP